MKQHPGLPFRIPSHYIPQFCEKKDPQAFAGHAPKKSASHKTERRREDGDGTNRIGQFMRRMTVRASARASFRPSFQTGGR